MRGEGVAEGRQCGIEGRLDPIELFDILVVRIPASPPIENIEAGLDPMGKIRSTQQPGITTPMMAQIWRDELVEIDLSTYGSTLRPRNTKSGPDRIHHCSRF